MSWKTDMEEKLRDLSDELHARRESLIRLTGQLRHRDILLARLLSPGAKVHMCPKMREGGVLCYTTEKGIGASFHPKGWYSVTFNLVIASCHGNPYCPYCGCILKHKEEE